MLTEKERQTLNQIAQGNTEHSDDLIIQLGAKGCIEVELPNGKPEVRKITRKGQEELADNAWLES